MTTQACPKCGSNDTMLNFIDLIARLEDWLCLACYARFYLAILERSCAIDEKEL